MVRRTLTDGRGGLGDVVGELVAWTGDTLTIRTRSGEVLVPAATVVAAKRVPAAATRRRRSPGEARGPRD